MEEKSKNAKFFIFIFAIPVSIIFFYSLQKEYYFYNNSEFGVAKTIEYISAGPVHKDIEYVYYVNKLKYTGTIGEDYDIKSPLNKFYKVKYSKTKPEISEIYLSERVTDSAQIVKAGFKN